jgi:hypothetical protein
VFVSRQTHLVDPIIKRRPRSLFDPTVYRRDQPHPTPGPDEHQTEQVGFVVVAVPNRRLQPTTQTPRLPYDLGIKRPAIVYLDQLRTLLFRTPTNNVKPLVVRRVEIEALAVEPERTVMTRRGDDRLVRPATMPCDYAGVQNQFG